MDSGQVLDPVAALRKLGGVGESGTLHAMCDPWQIRVAVAQGDILRLGPRRYTLPTADEAHQAAARLNGVVSHLSAAVFWGWKVKCAPELPQVTVPRRRKRSPEEREGCDVHWADLPAEDLHRRAVTTPVRTVIDCARTLPFDEALCVADSALRSGRVTRAELVVAAKASPRTGRARALRVVLAADERAANPFESCLRATCHDVAGLSVEPQFSLAGIGRVDLADVQLRLVLEAESLEFHNDALSFRNDVRRYTALVRAQWRVARFCWEDVMFQQEYVRAVLTDLVAAGPPTYGQFVVAGLDPRLGQGA